MQVLLLTLQTLLIIPVTGRRVPPKRINRFFPLTLTTPLLRKRPCLPVNLHPTIMTVYIIALLLEEPTVKFQKRLHLLTPPTLKRRNLHDEPCLHSTRNNRKEI
jgi:hypothetical protein